MNKRMMEDDPSAAGLAHRQAPEAERMKAEVAALEAALARRESDLAALRAAVLAFEARYLKVLGRLYDQLAEIEALIAAAQGVTSEEGEAAGEASAFDDEVGCGQNRFHAEKLKKLYREVARKCHPDLSADDEERHLRHQLMVEVNRAYEAGSAERLQALLDAGTDGAPSAGGSTAASLLLARRIAQIKEGLIGIEAEIAEVEASEIYKLKLRVESAEANGLDLLSDLVAQVERQIAKARNRLIHLQPAPLQG